MATREAAAEQGEHLQRPGSGEADLVSGGSSSSEQLAATKKSTKSLLAQPFKSLREAGRSASLKLRRAARDLHGDNMSGAEYNSSSASSTLEKPARSKGKKSKDKKVKQEQESVETVQLYLPDSPAAEGQGNTKKGKKKKGSSLVRKFSSKIRSKDNKDAASESSSPRLDTVATPEMSGGSEDSQSVASSSFQSAGARTPDQSSSPLHPLQPTVVLQQPAEQVTITSSRPSPTPPPRKQQKITGDQDETQLAVRAVLCESVLPESALLVTMETPNINTREEEEKTPEQEMAPEVKQEEAPSAPEDPEDPEDPPSTVTEEEEEEVLSAEQTPPRTSESPQPSTSAQGAAAADTVKDITFPAALEPSITPGSGKDNPAQQGGEPGQRREHLYKILVIGELGTGKTSIIKRYVHQFFSQHYRATIGVDFALKVLTWDQNTVIRLQLWDIAGQERFGNMTRVYYKEAVGAFIVFDVTRTATFDAVLKWKADLDSKVQLPDGSPIPCVLLANKCDQQKEGLANTPARMDEYCKEHGFSGWYETSAKENINIDEAARFLVTKILQNDKVANLTMARDKDGFALDGAGGRSEGGGGKSCAC